VYVEFQVVSKIQLFVKAFVSLVWWLIPILRSTWERETRRPSQAKSLVDPNLNKEAGHGGSYL
jgi:hypothetical protein